MLLSWICALDATKVPFPPTGDIFASTLISVGLLAFVCPQAFSVLNQLKKFSF